MFQSTLATGLFVGILQGYDFLADMNKLPSLSHEIFDYFTPPLQGSAKNEEGWYWFDMLHYRQTGKFAQNLIKLAKTDEQKAYAYGYFTHVATDMVGHPYVNQIVGGPYRLHPQRHAACENFMDTWAYSQQYNENINSTLHTRQKLPKSKKLYQLDYELTKDITNFPQNQRPKLINKDKGADAGFLTPQNIQETYQVFCFVAEVLGNSHVEKPKEPFSGILDILNDMLKGFKPPPSPPGISKACSIWDILSFGTTSKSRDCYKNFADNISEWLGYLGELLSWAFQTISHLLDSLLTLLLSLPIAAVMGILYGIQLLLYAIYKQARWVLALNGFVYPEPDEVLGTSHGRNLITPFQCDQIHGPMDARLIKVFPQLAYPRTHLHSINHLQCPTGDPESPRTVCAWYPRSEKILPSKFMKFDTFNEKNLEQYAKATDPSATRAIEEKKLEIGNAIDLSVWILQNANDQTKKDIVYCDWNLDSDRGYGYKCWAADNLPNKILKGEKYV